MEVTVMLVVVDVDTAEGCCSSVTMEEGGGGDDIFYYVSTQKLLVEKRDIRQSACKEKNYLSILDN